MRQAIHSTPERQYVVRGRFVAANEPLRRSAFAGDGPEIESSQGHAPSPSRCRVGLLAGEARPITHALDHATGVAISELGGSGALI